MQTADIKQITELSEKVVELKARSDTPICRPDMSVRLVGRQIGVNERTSEAA